MGVHAGGGKVGYQAHGLGAVATGASGAMAYGA